MQKVVESYVHCMYCFIVRITLLMLKVSNTSAHDDLMSYICSHGHKNIVQCVKWNQNGNWVLTASKDQIIKVNIFCLCTLFCSSILSAKCSVYTAQFSHLFDMLVLVRYTMGMGGSYSMLMQNFNVPRTHHQKKKQLFSMTTSSVSLYRRFGF